MTSSDSKNEVPVIRLHFKMLIIRLQFYELHDYIVTQRQKIILNLLILHSSFFIII